MLNRSTRLRPLALVAFVVALAFTLYMALHPQPPHPLGNIWDKYQHALAFGTLTLLAAWAFPTAFLARLGERLSFVGALIEVAQTLPQIHRDCDLYDWVADTVGIIVVAVLVGLMTRSDARAVGHPPAHL